MAREQLQSLTEPMFFILLALTRPMHGYEIMQTVTNISRGRVTVGAGTLYALLTRFEKEEIIRLVGGSILVFYAEANTPPPVPIHTDKKIQAQIYLKASRKTELRTYISLSIVILINAYSQSRSGIEVFLSNARILALIGYLIWFLTCFWRLAQLFLWYQHTKKTAEQDLPLPVEV